MPSGKGRDVPTEILDGRKAFFRKSGLSSDLKIKGEGESFLAESKSVLFSTQFPLMYSFL
jgi:hypothetical protein